MTNQIQLSLDAQTAAFYSRIAEASGRTMEQVLTDALFKLAGELSLQALYQAGTQKQN